MTRLPRYMNRGRKAGKSPVAGVDPSPRGSFVVEATWERAEELRVDRLGPGEDDVQVNDPERPVKTIS